MKRQEMEAQNPAAGSSISFNLILEQKFPMKRLAHNIDSLKRRSLGVLLLLLLRQVPLDKVRPRLLCGTIVRRLSKSSSTVTPIERHNPKYLKI